MSAVDELANENSHCSSYDVLGRLSLDAVTTLDDGVDGTVRALGYTYDSQGLPFRFTSYSNAAATTIVNQVQRDYDEFGHLMDEYQSTDGAVDTSTTPELLYDYGGGNRLRSITYPNGRVVDYYYGSSGSINNHISRLQAVQDQVNYLAAFNTLETYTYLGLGTVVQRTRNQPGTSMSYIQQSGDTLTSSDGGDQYTGLDRFGRVIDQDWITNSTHANTDRFQYAYDRDGNPLSKNNIVVPGLSELYHANSSSTGDNAAAYDGLNRLTDFRRGTLTASGHNGSSGLGSLDTVSSGNLSSLAGSTQGWSLDAVGNSSSTSTDGSSTSRSNNAQNQITSNGDASYSYDANGSRTADAGSTYTYSAWNQLVGAGASGTYQYDAMGRRVELVNPLNVQTRFLYNSAWQVVQDQVEDGATTQYVWNPTQTDSLIARDVYSKAGTLDPSIGGGTGITFPSLPGTNTSGTQYHDMASLDSTHAVTLSQNGSSGFVLADFDTTTGELDTGFGSGDGFITSTAISSPASVTVQSDGKIVVVGTTSGNMTVERFNSDGSVDTAFGTSGVGTITFGSDSSSATSVAMEGTKIIVGGYINSDDFAVGRLTSSGSLDTSFNSTGKLTTDMGGSGDQVNAVSITTISSATKIIAAGTDGAGLAIAMYNDDGSLDTAFNTTGKLVDDSKLIGYTRGYLLGDRAIITRSGGFYVAGDDGDGTYTYGQGTIGVYNFDNDGTLAGTFGTSFDMQFLSIGQSGDGKFTVAGVAADEDDQFTVVRFNSDGTEDTTFADNGRSDILDLGDGTTAGALLLPDGRTMMRADSSSNILSVMFLGTSQSSRLYAQQDANDNTTSLMSTSGTVLQRMVYGPYGSETALNAAGTSTVTDAYQYLYGFQGGRLDPITGFINFRHRDLDTATGTWIEQDPTRYVDGANMYQPLGVAPIASRDPAGLDDVGDADQCMVYCLDDAPPGNLVDPLLDKWRSLVVPTRAALEGLLSPNQKNCPKCEQEATDLADAMATAVASQGWQFGGGFGNFTSGITGVIVHPLHPIDGWNTGGWGNQCGDWQRLLQAAMKPILDAYGADSCFDAVTADGKSGPWTHNWVELSTLSGTLILDPYATGGSKIIDSSTAAGYPNASHSGVGQSAPPWSPRYPRTRRPASQPSSRPSDCPCDKK